MLSKTLHTVLFTFLLFIYEYAIGQSVSKSEILAEFLANHPPLNDSLFLNPNCYHPMKIFHQSNWQKMWSDQPDSVQTISQLYDSRIKFNSKKDALRFQKDFLDLLTDKGEKITNPKISAPGAKKMMVFIPNEENKKLLEMVERQSFCFIFVKDNYFVKISVICSLQWSPDFFQPMVDDAIRRINQFGQ